MAVWALQDAKAKFSELVDRALTEGPQEVTRHGRPVVMIVATVDYRRWVASGSDIDLGQFLADTKFVDKLESAS